MHVLRRENVIQMPIRVVGTRGIVDWLLQLFHKTRLTATKKKPQAQMRLIETMSLGGRRQLMLVSCCGREFLVAADAETIRSIVPMRRSRKDEQQEREANCEETV